MNRIFYWVDHTAGCEVNSGVQRVTRCLGRCLLELGAQVTPVAWDEDRKAIVPATGAQLRHLQKWNGPDFSRSRRHGMFRPLRDLADRLPAFRRRKPIHEDRAYATEIQGAWLLVPEVTHITSHVSPTTAPLIEYAKAHGLRTAFLFYDALPLKHEIYRAMRDAHVSYMRTLAAADCLIPISVSSGEDLRSFYAAEQCLDHAAITPCLLAGEVPGVPRAGRIAAGTREVLDVLSVGSIDTRKNQPALVRAFQAVLRRHPSAPWRLTLAGNVSQDTAQFIMYAARDPRIRFIHRPEDQVLAGLYRDCYFTVFPSVDEGFGLPIVESLWFGKPCICAEFGSMREVAEGGGCLLVDTRSEEAIGLAIERLLTDQDRVVTLQEEAIRRPIKTWRHYAAEVMGILGIGSIENVA